MRFMATQADALCGRVCRRPGCTVLQLRRTTPQKFLQSILQSPFVRPTLRRFWVKHQTLPTAKNFFTLYKRNARNSEHLIALRLESIHILCSLLFCEVVSATDLLLQFFDDIFLLLLLCNLHGCSPCIVGGQFRPKREQMLDNLQRNAEGRMLLPVALEKGFRCNGGNDGVSCWCLLLDPTEKKRHQSRG